MKKAMIFMVFGFAGFSTFAQVQRKVADTNKIAGTEQKQNAMVNEPASFSKKKDKLKLVKALNLTREQKKKLKEMRQANEAKKVAILNDGSLTADQKQSQLKAIKRSAAVDLQGILNEAQKKKMKEMRKERKDGNGDEMMIEE